MEYMERHKTIRFELESLEADFKDLAAANLDLTTELKEAKCELDTAADELGDLVKDVAIQKQAATDQSALMATALEEITGYKEVINHLCTPFLDPAKPPNKIQRKEFQLALDFAKDMGII